MKNPWIEKRQQKEQPTAWHHITVTCDMSAWQVIIDGVVVEAKALSSEEIKNIYDRPYDCIGYLQDQVVREMQLQEDADIFNQIKGEAHWVVA